MNEILQQRIEKAARRCCQDKNYMQPLDFKPSLETLTAIDAYIAGATFALQNQWISVEEDLPKYDVAVIAMEYNPELSWEDQNILFAHRSKNPDVWKDKNDFCIYPPTIMKITYWMETPRLEGGKK